MRWTAARTRARDSAPRHLSPAQRACRPDMSVASPRYVNVVRPVPRPPPQPPPLPARLPRVLRTELRRLRAREMLRRDAAVADPRDRPRFITTVKTGQYLLPPPEVATLLGLEALYPARERDRLVYSYVSRPKAVGSRGRRHLPPVTRPCASRHDGHTGGVSTTHYSNMMHEKRIVRGSTFSAHPHAAGDGAEGAAARAARSRRRALARRAAAAAARLRPGTPPPAPGRRHHPVQTEYYLEELFDKGVELEVGVQTDLFVDRPGTPIYVPAKTGADAHTQIYPGDLFDFEVEVQPILEVLVGKTIEQALGEVAQEEELATLREQQRRYCELREAERAERHRLAAQHRRLHDEKERRLEEATAAREAARDARETVAAATLVRAYVADLLPAVLAGLRDHGYLLNRLQRGLDEEFMPWLVREVSHEIESIITSRDVIAEIVRDVVEARGDLFASAAERDAAATPPPADSATPPSPHEPDPEENHLEE